MPGAGNGADNAARSRRLWQLVEPYHAVVYFAPEARESYAAAGLKGGWMGYFASRAAAMGPVPAAVVVATFYNFHPNMVGRAIPDAWRFSTPEVVLDARRRVADLALRRLLGEGVEGGEVAAAAGLARRAAEACDPAGRALFAAHASLTWPDEPHLVLWHAATLLREFRGDGHVATLLANGIDGCEAHVLITAEGVMPPKMQREFRGWSEDEWDAAAGRLRRRDLIDTGGALTDAGRRLRAAVEAATDALSAAPYDAIGDEACDRLKALMASIARRLVAAGAVPYPNPMGLRPGPAS